MKKPLIIGSVTLGACCLVLYAHYQTSYPGEPSTLTSTQAHAEQTASPPPLDTTNNSAGSAAPHRVDPTAVVPDRASEFHKLVATGKPADAFAAYMLASNCIWARGEFGEDPNLPPEQRKPPAVRINEACGNLTASEIGSRFKYVKQAAEAGVPLAAIQLVAEGPNGNRQILYEKPNDPAVLAWREDMTALIELAAQKGDYTAMSSLANMYENGTGVVGKPDYPKALQYATAMWEVYQKTTGRLSPFAAAELVKLEKAMTPEQAIAAREAGIALATEALESKYK